MGLTQSLTASLTLLGEALDDPDLDLPAAVNEFAETIRSAVGSFEGLSLHVTGPIGGLGFTLMGEDATWTGPGSTVGASLLLPMLPTDGEQCSEIVLYAANPGAFVDLAADLAVLTATPLPELVLDEHLDPDRRQQDITEVLDAAVIDQAVGVLLGWGWTPEEASAALDDRPARRGKDRLGAAAELIADLARGTGGWWVNPPPWRA